MLPLKLVTSLVSGEKFTNNPLFLSQNHHFSHQNLDNHDDDNSPNTILSRNRIPLLIFVPNQEIVKDTYRLCRIARAIGMDLYPNPSLSHIILSWPASSSSSSSSTWSLRNGTVPLPFPSFKNASLSHLRLFVNLSNGYFKLAFLNNSVNVNPLEKIESSSNNNWHCTSLSLVFAPTREKIESMDGFSKALLGMGWTLFKTTCGDLDSGKSVKMAMYLYRKSGVSGICNAKRQSSEKEDFGQFSRVRELRLPPLDFRNVPLRILQYILLMTDDIFYLA